MRVCGPLYSPAALSPDREPSMSTAYKVVWAQEPQGIFWGYDNLLYCWGIEPRSSVVSP